MITVRKSSDRGHANHGWLDTYHTFSFADYFDRAHMHFHALRVINEDRVAPKRGFDSHPHRDMEIITYILEGELAHKDDMGNGSVIRPGDVQYMSAGSGVIHSEYNNSPTAPVHLMQIWIMPNVRGAAPTYDQKFYGEEARNDALKLLVSADGRDGSIKIRQDLNLYASILHPGAIISHKSAKNRAQWIQLLKGNLNINGIILNPGDGAGIEDEGELTFVSSSECSEFLLFDLVRD